MEGLVVAGGNSLNSERLKKICSNADIVVAADSGIKHLIDSGCLVDYLVGDMDSIEKNLPVNELFPGIEVFKYPIGKDKTDTELATDLLVEKGCKKITIIGGTGNRLDHTLANIYLLRSLYLKNIDCKIIDDNNEIVYLKEESIIIKEKKYFHSIIPLSLEGIKVTLEGFHYPLLNTIIKCGSSLGISNYIEADKARIIKHSGEGLLIKSKD